MVEMLLKLDLALFLGNKLNGCRGAEVAERDLCEDEALVS
jgi:hypothetical protein